MKNDMKQDKAMVKSALGKHEKGMHPGKPMTKLSSGGYTKAADGCATKGKTKGKMVSMAMGGKTKKAC